VKKSMTPSIVPAVFVLTAIALLLWTVCHPRAWHEDGDDRADRGGDVARVLWVYTPCQELDVQALEQVLRRGGQPPDDVMVIAMPRARGAARLLNILPEDRYVETKPPPARMVCAYNPRERKPLTGPEPLLSAPDQSRLVALRVLPHALEAAERGGYTHIAHLPCDQDFRSAARHSFSADVALLLPEAVGQWRHLAPVGFRSDILASAVEALADMLHRGALEDRLEALAAVSTVVRIPAQTGRKAAPRHARTSSGKSLLT